MTKTYQVLLEVERERGRQDKKWGQQNHGDAMWSLILGEEVGEACNAVLERLFQGSNDASTRDELIQVAAVAVAWVEAIDRRST